MLPNSPKCAALRTDMKGDRQNSRFQQIHKNKLVKAQGVVEGKSVITQDEYRF